MSELLKNREYRREVLKEIIRDLHQGKTVDQVKKRFAQTFQGVSATEIAELEQALIQEGLSVEEVQNLCDVHAAVFKGSIEEIHHAQKAEETPGHPLHTFKLENREIEKLIEDIQVNLEDFWQDDRNENIVPLLRNLESLREIDKHYARKENLLFPLLEKYGITAPPKVMWGVDDEIRSAVKEAINFLSNYHGGKEEAKQRILAIINKVNEMIFKEENILFPMAMETLTEDEWRGIAEESAEIGFCLTKPQGEWKPVNINVEAKVQAEGERSVDEGYIRFETGLLTPEEIGLIFNTLPVDITFVDREGTVKYFSQTKERIFPRTKTVIGRNVVNCHPPASVHIVEKVVEDLQTGRKDQEEFWLRMGPRYVYIRYFAVRNTDGAYLGTLEVTQDIQPLQEITGEKRLLEEMAPSNE
ncbi:MAG TPA: DUF438 domain-containing protein [Firmicutes bacterium]|nr:DUF438 domain-containing protein [Bacillota bacterium]